MSSFVSMSNFLKGVNFYFQKEVNKEDLTNLIELYKNMLLSVEDIFDCFKKFFELVNSDDLKNFEDFFKFTITYLIETIKVLETGIEVEFQYVCKTPTTTIIYSSDEMCERIIFKIRQCEIEKGIENPKEINIDDLKTYDNFVFYILYYILLQKYEN
jgi:hypothetical protein